MILRDYQEQQTAGVRQAFTEGCRSVILYGATGSGKTCVFCDMASKAVRRGKRALIIGDSTEIIDQTSASLDECGVPHGIIQGQRRNRKPWEPVHVATIQTLRNRELPPVDLVVADEAHLCRSDSWEKVIQHYKSAGAYIVGATATPCRLDGKGLGKLFDRIVYGPSVAELTSAGWLAPFRIFAPGGPNMHGVGAVAGEFDKAKRAARADKPKLVGDIVQHWLNCARGRRTAVSAASIPHSLHIRDAFRAAGVSSEHVDGTTKHPERKRILQGLPRGEYMVLCQVGIVGKGWDCPELEALVDACPTMSLARWLQFVGRGGRISPATGKTDCILLDHSGNTFAKQGGQIVRRFGYPDEDREWSLDGAETTQHINRDTVESVRMCKVCWFAFRGSQQRCPSCGTPYTTLIRQPEVEAGELQEITRERKQLAIAAWRERQTDDARLPDDERKRRADARRKKFDEFIRIGLTRGYKPGFAIQRYRAIFLEDPPREWMQTAFMAARAGEGAAVNS
jgi:DNA repair protein RadD